MSSERHSLALPEFTAVSGEVGGGRGVNDRMWEFVIAALQVVVSLCWAASNNIQPSPPFFILLLTVCYDSDILLITMLFIGIIVAKVVIML